MSLTTLSLYSYCPLASPDWSSSFGKVWRFDIVRHQRLGYIHRVRLRARCRPCRPCPQPIAAVVPQKKPQRTRSDRPDTVIMETGVEI